MLLQNYLNLKVNEGDEGSANLKSIYKDLNTSYFSGGLPSIKLRWTGKLKKAVGQAYVSYIRPAGSKRRRKSALDKFASEIPIQNSIEINMSSLEIRMSKTFDLSMNDIKAVMLHEMVHILLYTQKKLGGHHGTAEFDGWIKKLRDLSGLNVPLMESNFKKSPKLTAKEGIVAVVYGNQVGKVGVSGYSINKISKDWLSMAEILTNHISHSSKVRKIEMYKVSHPIVSAIGAKRTFKGLSWSWEDESIIKEIIAKGTIFFVADKQGGWLVPKKIGISISNLNNTPLLFNPRGQWINQSDVMK